MTSRGADPTTSDIIARHRFAGRVLVVELQGRLTLGPATNDLKSRLEVLLTAGSAAGLLLEFSAAAAFDSAGIGELMKIHAYAMRRGLPLALTGVTAKLEEMLKVTRLDGLFTIRPDEASALQQLAQPKVADQP